MNPLITTVRVAKLHGYHYLPHYDTHSCIHPHAHTQVGAADVMDKHQRSKEKIEMAGQQQVEVSHKVRDRVRLMKWDVLNLCESTSRM